MADAFSGTVDQQALDEVVTFTSELIRIDTTNRGGGDCSERPAAEYAAELLAGAGLEPTILERTPAGGNVVARIEGTDPSADALLVHGHLDVVPAEAADWSVHPFSGEVRDGVVWGPGRRRHEEHGRDDPRDRTASGPASGTGRGATSSSRSPPTRRPAPRTARASSPTGTPASSRAAPKASASPALFTFHDGSGKQLYPIAAGSAAPAG